MLPRATQPELGAVVLGDIVERHTSNNSSPPLPPPPLRPVMGSGFPSVNASKRYGLKKQTMTTTITTTEPSVGRIGAAMASAHVQPEEASYHGDAVPSVTNNNTAASGGAVVIPVGGAGTSSRQMAHQWGTADFVKLYRGYYAAPLPAHLVTQNISALGGDNNNNNNSNNNTDSASIVTGEDFFALIFQCLRSTVRKHQEVALHALLLHLRFAQHEQKKNTTDINHATKGPTPGGGDMLRERCTHGPDCAPFLFFIMEVLASAAHPLLCALSAAVLVLLLGISGGGGTVLDRVEEAIGEIGAPPADYVSPEDDEDEDENNNNEEEKKDGGQRQKYEDDPDLPFSDISELLRGDDFRAGLEKMGFTNKVMSAMPLLLCAQEENNTNRMNHKSLWLELLQCGNLCGSPVIAKRVAADPLFMQYVETAVQAMILGEVSYGEHTALLLIVLRLVHMPDVLPLFFNDGMHNSSTATTAASALTQETWELFFLSIFGMKPEELKSAADVVACMLSMLLLREMIRSGCALGLMNDICDTVVSDGMRVGAAIALEMWVLQDVQHQHSHHHADPKEMESNSSRAHMLKEAALAALSFISRSNPTTAQEDATTVTTTESMEATEAQLMLHQLVHLANCHFLSTYLRAHRLTAFTLLGTAVETQRQVQLVLARDVLTGEALQSAFARLRFSHPTRAAAEEEAEAEGESVASLSGLGSLPLDVTESVNQLLALTTADNTKKMKNITNSKSALSLAAAESIRRRTWLLALNAALTHGTMRLAHAVVDTFPAVSAQPVCAYAAALSSKYALACLSMRRGAVQRLQPDELLAMVEVMSMLHEQNARSITGASDNSDADKNKNTGASVYGLDAQHAALFLVHSIAITKHCLDAAPKAIACLLQGLSSSTNDADDAADMDVMLGLGQSLLLGVENAPIPTADATITATGAARPWALYPLYDVAYEDKQTWAAWLRRVLGSHKDAKTVLGWDAMLSHTLLWVLDSRRPHHPQQKLHDDDDDDDTTNSNALLVLLLELVDLISIEGNHFSLAASEALSVSLSAAAAPTAEERLPRGVALALAVTVTQCQPSVALTAMHLLLASPERDDEDAGHSDDGGVMHRVRRMLTQWGQSGAVIGHDRAHHAAVRWSLEDVVSLIQLVGPPQSSDDAFFTNNNDDDEEWSSAPQHAADGHVGFMKFCISSLTDGILRSFIAQQKATNNTSSTPFDAMTREVLRGTMEEVGWLSPILMPLIE